MGSMTYPVSNLYVNFNVQHFISRKRFIRNFGLQCDRYENNIEKRVISTGLGYFFFQRVGFMNPAKLLTVLELFDYLPIKKLHGANRRKEWLFK